MTVVTTLDVNGWTAPEHRAVLDELGVETHPAITATPLHNLFGPRLAELPGLIATLPGAPRPRETR